MISIKENTCKNCNTIGTYTNLCNTCAIKYQIGNNTEIEPNKETKELMIAIKEAIEVLRGEKELQNIEDFIKESTEPDKEMEGEVHTKLHQKLGGFTGTEQCFDCNRKELGKN